MCRALQKTAGDKDLVILISLSGESQAVVELGRALRTNHVPAVSITRLKNNTLASLCSENLYINSIQMPVEYDVEYEIATPYFILIGNFSIFLTEISSHGSEEKRDTVEIYFAEKSVQKFIH